MSPIVNNTLRLVIFMRATPPNRYSPALCGLAWRGVWWPWADCSHWIGAVQNGVRARLSNPFRVEAGGLSSGIPLGFPAFRRGCISVGKCASLRGRCALRCGNWPRRWNDGCFRAEIDRVRATLRIALRKWTSFCQRMAFLRGNEFFFANARHFRAETRIFLGTKHISAGKRPAFCQRSAFLCGNRLRWENGTHFCASACIPSAKEPLLRISWIKNIA
jgi:hypothetical protein